MSIRFAAAHRPLRHRMAARQALAACRPPANDNPVQHFDRETLNAALRHFARHGMAAASQAAAQARAARAAGDMAAHAYWLEICRTLDRRMALRLEHGR